MKKKNTRPNPNSRRQIQKRQDTEVAEARTRSEKASQRFVTSPDPERLQKFLAQHGYGSRRQAEDWIRAGRIKVNGIDAELGQKVDASDRISLDGRLLRFTTPIAQTIMYRKRVGEIVTRKDPEGRPTVFSRLPKLDAGRWVAVGRLDLNTSGLMLFTTDGELARRLMHPSSEVEREYAVRVLGEVDENTLNKLKEGIELEDGFGHFDTLVDQGSEGANRWYHVTLSEGRNRIVRRMWEAVDCQVSRLIRVRYGPINLPSNLASSKSRPLDKKELKALYASLPSDEPTQ
ncbi:MAG: 23S rRNA pseudouridine(2605) synthase RluB [Oceanococcus sp.]